MEERKIINIIRNLEETEIDEWINRRLDILEATAEENRPDISLNSFLFRRAKGEKENTEVHGFIPSTTLLKKMAYDLNGFTLDDRSYYRDVVNYIRNVDEKTAFNNNYIMNVIQCKIIQYFGMSGNETRRNNLYESSVDFEDKDGGFNAKPLSIRDFKSNGTAMCVERSAMAQNILSFLGYDPMLIMGYMSTNKGITNEAHAYNCIIRNGKAMLADFTNPIYKDGKFYRAATFPIDGEKLEDFKKGRGQVEIIHKDLKTVDGQVVEIPTNVVLASEEIEPKYYENNGNNQKKSAVDFDDNDTR